MAHGKHKKSRNRGSKAPPRPSQASCDELMNQALELHRQGRVPEAAELYEKVLADRPEHPEALHMLGLTRFQSGAPEAACQLVSRSLELAPDTLSAMGNLASILAALNRREEAAGLLRRALELAPDHAPYWRGLGDALAGLQRLEEACEAYEKALERWPTGVDKGALPHNYAVTLSGLKRHQEAADILKDVLAWQPGNLAAHCTLGHALRELDQLDDACKAFGAALDLEPDMPQALLGLAGCLEKLGELDQALPHACRARELDPCEDTWFREGHLLQELGEYDAARTCYNKVLSCNPRNAVAMNNLGVLAMNEGDTDAAAIWFGRARDADPGYAEAWTNWANLLEKKGELERAESIARKGVALCESPSSLVRLGYVLQRQGRIDEALEVYNRLLEIDPADSKGVTLYLAAIGLRNMPSRASDAHVRELFDHYAGFFEKHLRDRLDYKGPEVMLAALSPWLQGQDLSDAASQGLDIMDLGCGTGLCGAVLSPFARRLDGVDLSPRMLAKARSRAIYRDLYEAELAACLESLEREYDCMVAGDVFVYLGDLEPVFAAARARLRPGGLFAFTLETHDDEGVKVNEGNRFQHSRGYLQQLAQAHGFEVLSMEQVVMRHEAGQPVSSLAAVLRAGPR